MKFKGHFIIGLLLSLMIFLVFPQIRFYGFIIIFLTNILIDIDHYLYYIYKTKNFSPIKCYLWTIKRIEKFQKIKKREEYKQDILIFHGIEFIFVLFLFSYFSPIFLYILLGIIIHLLVDIPDLIYLEYPLRLKISSLLTFLKNKRKI